MRVNLTNLVPALILIAVGVLFLAANLGLIKGGIGAVFAIWWPIVPLATGIGLLFWHDKNKDKNKS